MIPIQYAFLLALPPVIAAAWFGGGRQERMTTGIVLVAIAFSGLLDGWRIGRSQTGAALCDLVLFLVLLYLALSRDRWWLLVVAATQGLVVTAHLALVLRPDLTSMENLAAVNVFYILGLLGLLGGVIERWLAGEKPAGPSLDVRRNGQPSGA